MRTDQAKKAAVTLKDYAALADGLQCDGIRCLADEGEAAQPLHENVGGRIEPGASLRHTKSYGHNPHC